MQLTYLLTISLQFLRDEVAASVPLQNQLWRRIVSAKIAMQGALLDFRSSNGGAALTFMARRVKSGNPQTL